MPVTAFDLRLQRPLAGGTSFGTVGPYEELKGRLRFVLDPGRPANARITDLGLAPPNAVGGVDFAADVSILLPVERGRGNGRLVLDVVNRGNTVTLPNFNHATRPLFGPDSEPDPAIDVGDGFLMRHGYVVVSCGWQSDLPDVPGLLRMYGPQALDRDGQLLRGRVYTQLQSAAPVTHMLLSDRGHHAYPAADVDEPDAMMVVRDQPDGPPTSIPRERWRFARVAGGAVVPDASHVHLDGGFEKGRLYQVIYTAKGAPVLGLGLAGLRDCASWLKHGAADVPAVAGPIRFAFAYGRSQTGRLLRTLVHNDLNLDEEGREVLDGILANVAGGLRGEFNQRFGQNSKDRPHMMAHLFPFTDVPQTDAQTRAAGALHARIDARGSRLKVFYTNSSAEYHRGDASLIHTDPDGRRDVSPGPHTRVYHFAGTEHGLGVWPPTDTQQAAADPRGTVERSQNLRGIIDYGRLLRACLVNLDRWVSQDVAPPASAHPRLDDGTAVDPDELTKVFDAIPGAHYPRHHPRPCRLDFGLDPDRRHTATLPPRDGPSYGSRVAAVDADGNEVAGILLPEVKVPLATHTGWTLRHPEIGGGQQLLVFAGATLPFLRTRAERERRADPRRSIEERYRSRDDYLASVRSAARELCAQRYLLEEDIERSVSMAARQWDFWTAASSR
ncbi:MAG: alpha/beta hydrolase domain-containing protein [Candidatus Rokuibacteriota bacterium]